MKKIGIILGSVRENRKALKIGKWVLNQLSESNYDIEIVDIKEFNLVHYNEPSSPRSGKNYQFEETKKWSQRIDEFNAYIFVTPEYNGFFTGALKDAIDYLYLEWENKDFIIVGYGGRGAKTASEHLSTLLKRFNMKDRGRVEIHKPWSSLKENGEVDSEFVFGNIKELVKNI